MARSALLGARAAFVSFGLVFVTFDADIAFSAVPSQPVAKLTTMPIAPPPASAPGGPAVHRAPALPGKGELAVHGSAAPAAAPVWSIDRAASRLSFRAQLNGLPVDGVFKAWDAQIAFDPKNLKASHAMFAVETSSALTGQPTRDSILPTTDWLWTHRFPKAVLVTRSIAPAGPGRYVASADLKVRGMARRVSVPFTLTLHDASARLQASFTLDRVAFGIGDPARTPSAALSPQVIVIMRLTAKRAH